MYLFMYYDILEGQKPFQVPCFLQKKEKKGFSFLGVPWVPKNLLYDAALCLVAQSCPTLCDPMHCSRQAPLSMGILQARILEWVAVPSSRQSSQSRDWIQAAYIAGRFFTVWARHRELKFGVLWQSRGMEWGREMREVQEVGDIHILIYGRNQHSIVKQPSSS